MTNRMVHIPAECTPLRASLLYGTNAFNYIQSKLSSLLSHETPVVVVVLCCVAW